MADGYSLEAAYTAEVWNNTSGGVMTGSRFLDNLDLTLSVDIEDAWNMGTGTLFAHVLYNNATSLSDELVGDIQTVSNIDAPEAIRLYEFWYEFGTELWSVRTGLYDLNSEFDTHETGALFINSSHGIGAEIAQTGENGPSIFPVTSFSIRGSFSIDEVTFRAAILDGVPGDPNDASKTRVDIGGEDGTLLVAEMDWRFADQWRAWTGIWKYSADFELPYEMGSSDANDGAYIGMEFTTTLSDLSISSFVRYGVADEDLNAVGEYLGAGVIVDSPFEGRNEDQIGLAVAAAKVSDPYRQNLFAEGIESTQWERTWELTYRATINGWLTLQPNVQYVQNPSATQTIKDSLLVGLRFELSLSIDR